MKSSEVIDKLESYLDYFLSFDDCDLDEDSRYLRNESILNIKESINKLENLNDENDSNEIFIYVLSKVKEAKINFEYSINNYDNRFNDVLNLVGLDNKDVHSNEKLNFIIDDACSNILKDSEPEIEIEKVVDKKTGTNSNIGSSLLNWLKLERKDNQ